MEALTHDDIYDESGVRSELKRAIEAILFAADEPVSAAQLGHVLGLVGGAADVKCGLIEDLISELNSELTRDGRALRIRLWGGGFRLTTSSEVSAYVKAYLDEDRSQKLSRSLMETVAIVAYRQPVTRPEVDFVRGVDSDYAMRKLLELSLIDVVGRSDAVGRPLLYGTTRRFLEQFGLNTLEELPDLKEIEEILSDPAFDRERARLLYLEREEAALVSTGDGESATGQLPNVDKALDE